MASTVELKSLKRSDSTCSDNKEKSIDSASSTPSAYLIGVSVTAALTAFHFGYAISSINVPSKIFLNCSTTTSEFLGCFPVSQAAWGLVGMGLPLGGWIGGSFAPSLVHKLGGLKPAILALNIPLIASYLLMSLAVNLPMLVIARCLVGFAAGASGTIVPLYLSSISPLQFRGLLTNFFQLFLCSGAFIAETIAYTADLGNHPWHWRFGFAAGILICFLQLSMNFFCNLFPNSPRDSSNEAAIVIREKLGIEQENIIKPDESNSVPEIVQNRNSLFDLVTFRIPEARKSLALGIILHAGQQISGVNAVFFYSTLIVGNSPSTPVFLTFINLTMTLVAIWLLDRSGRRPVTLFSVAGSSASLIALSGSFFLVPALAPLFLITFVACFAVGLGPVPWMLVPEIFPATWPLTPAASAICVSANWITNILVTGGFPLLAQIFKKDWIFLSFGIFCSLLFMFLSKFLPETKNKISNFI